MLENTKRIYTHSRIMAYTDLNLWIFLNWTDVKFGIVLRNKLGEALLNKAIGQSTKTVLKRITKYFYKKGTGKEILLFKKEINELRED